MRRLALVLAATALVSPAAASAKGWLIVSTPSGGVDVGERWDATLRFPIPADRDATPVPRHPELVFTHLASDVKRRFSAEPTRRGGVFRARVVLPKAGTWRVYV